MAISQAAEDQHQEKYGQQASAVERLGYRQWANNAEPTYITRTQLLFRIDSRAGTADYSLAKKNNPVLSESQ